MNSQAATGQTGVNTMSRKGRRKKREVPTHIPPPSYPELRSTLRWSLHPLVPPILNDDNDQLSDVERARTPEDDAPINSVPGTGSEPT